MSRWSAKRSNFTPVAVADTTNFTDAGYFALQGASATQRIEVQEVSVSGLASASAPAQMTVSRDSTIGATALSGGTNAALDPATAALAAPPVSFSTSTTKPQRSATLQLLDISMNTFGGIYRWQVNRGDGIGMLGNTAALLGELSLSHLSTGTPGLIGCHFIFEPL